MTADPSVYCVHGLTITDRCIQCEQEAKAGKHRGFAPALEQPSSKQKFNDEPYLLDWSGHGGSPFEVARVYPPTRTLVEIRECDLNVEGARALRDWLNKVLPNE